MIVELIIVFALDLVDFLLSLLPEDSYGWPDGSGWASWAGTNAGPFNVFLPLEEVSLLAYYSVTIILPITLAVRLSLFLWFLLPVIK